MTTKPKQKPLGRKELCREIVAAFESDVKTSKVAHKDVEKIVTMAIDRIAEWMGEHKHFHFHGIGTFTPSYSNRPCYNMKTGVRYRSTVFRYKFKLANKTKEIAQTLEQ